MNDKTAAARHELIKPEDTPNYFADGISETLISANVTKVVFYCIDQAASADKVEKRRVTFSMHLPTIAFVEYLAQMRTAMAKNRPNLQAALVEAGQKVEKALTSMAASTEASGEGGAPKAKTRAARH